MNRIREVFIHPLIFMVLLISTVALIIHLLAIPDASGLFDQTLLYFIAGISALSALFILVRTQWRDWTALGAGLLGHFLAVGLVYFISVYYANNALDAYTHVLILIARATLIISGLFVLYGIISEWLEDIDCGPRCLWDRITHPIHNFKRWFSKHER